MFLSRTPLMIKEDQKGVSTKGAAMNRPILPTLRLFLQSFLGELVIIHPHHGYPFWGTVFWFLPK